ncbi:MAG: ACP S-malonyltransferase [Kofleriaceae bacterium]
MTAIAMFPGQSSRYPDMIAKLEGEPGVTALLRDASEILGRDLAKHYRGSDVFPTNRDVQVGVFLANHLHLMLLGARGITFEHSLGLSLGEYNHLVHAGAIGFADCLRLVDARGVLYDQARDGKMVSVFPLEPWLIETAIEKLGVSAQVGIGLYNSPRQQVISGHADAVDRVIAELEVDHYFDATVIEPRIPMHAPAFAWAGRAFADILGHFVFTSPAVYVANVAGVIERPTAIQIRDCLVDHVSKPVRWQRCVDELAARVPDPIFVEVGPRSVLHNLFGKDWMPGKRAKSDAAIGTGFDALREALCTTT